MLSSLKFFNFRNYQSASFVPAKINVIHGANGAGKTNILEAVSMLAPGKGLRSASLEEMANSNCGEWAIIAEIDGYKIATGLENGFSKRTVKIDDEKQRGTNTLAEYAAVIWLTPQMDGIFQESNSERRRFFDRIIYNFDPEHASRVAVYENAMRERLRLLKDGVRDDKWLKVLEKRMAEYGVAIAAARNEVIGYLQAELNSAHKTSFPIPRIEIRGKYEEILHNSSALETENILSADLFANRYSDSENGRTNSGVHKTDFHVVFSPKNMPANLSSTGEQKALLLSIILSLTHLMKSRKNKSPIILLDEVIAHLDENRRKELFAEIEALNCQSFLTGTDKKIFENINAQFLQITDGKISVN